MVSAGRLTPRATSAKQEENAEAKVSKTNFHALLPMASTAAGLRDAASHGGVGGKETKVSWGLKSFTCCRECSVTWLERRWREGGPMLLVCKLPRKEINDG